MMMQMHGKPNSHFYAYLDISVDIYQCTSPDEIQEFKMHRSASKIRQESWLFYRQIFQDFAAIATKFLRFINLNS